MGARGPKPLPANVHMLRGNPSKLPSSQLMDSLQPEIEIPGCPPHLLPEARKEWKRITPELERYGLISKIDRAALALYCQAWARWVWAERELTRAQQLAETKRAEAEAKGEVWTGGDGYTYPTKNGHLSYSPHWVIANKAMDQVNRFLADFGMSPSARGRVNPSNLLQRTLPGMGDDGGDGDGAQPPAGFGGL
jgi:P27 family predicted phage terminase small subunit